MATYEAGTVAITYNWASVIGHMLESNFGADYFYIMDTDGNFTEVFGTGFTYNASLTGVTGGTVTGMERSVGGANAEQISGFSMGAAAFWALSGANEIAAALSGPDYFFLNQTELSGSGGTYIVNGYAGGGTKSLDEFGWTGDTLEFLIGAGTEELSDISAGKTIPLTNINSFEGSSVSYYTFDAQPVAGLSLDGLGGVTEAVSMAYVIDGGTNATLDLSNESLSGINYFEFTNSQAGSGVTRAKIVLSSSQFSSSGLLPNLTMNGDGTAINDTLDILMSLTATSFSAAMFNFDRNWVVNTNDNIIIDGSGSLRNLLIDGPDAVSTLLGGSGDDTFIASESVDAPTTINGGGGFNIAEYSVASGLVTETHNADGSWTISGDGFTDTLTNVEDLQFTDKTIAIRQATTADFTGNATSDVLWINPTNGTVGDWLMSDGAPTWHVVGQGSSTVNVVGIGDFTRDGTSDVLWENPTNGIVGDWLMNNNVPTWQQIGQGSTTMNIAGVGDFNGDGTSDILWQNPTNGYVGIWQMQNNVPTWEAIGYGSTTVNIAGVGDFTGNGKDDILWENPSNGIVGMWSINGSTPTWSQIGQGSTTMNIVGVGDFTGNGTDDILWENPTNGLVGFWGMNNGQATSWNVVANANTSYQVAGIGDYYGNGTNDILWRNASTGDVGVWAMNNGQATWHDLGISSTSFNTVKT